MGQSLVIHILQECKRLITQPGFLRLIKKICSAPKHVNETKMQKKKEIMKGSNFTNLFNVYDHVTSL